MAMSPKLKSKLAKVAGGTALTIVIALLGGPEGVGGQRSTPYRDVGGVWTVCSGITGPDVAPGHYYSDKECDTLLVKHLVPVKKPSTLRLKCLSIITPAPRSTPSHTTSGWAHSGIPCCYAT